MVETPCIILEAFKAAHREIVPDVESEAIHLDILFGHLLFVEEYLLSVGVVPGPLVGVRQYIVGLINLDESLFGALV